MVLGPRGFVRKFQHCICEAFRFLLGKNIKGTSGRKLLKYVDRENI